MARILNSVLPRDHLGFFVQQGEVTLGHDANPQTDDQAVFPDSID